jgi:hypothetical protein
VVSPPLRKLSLTNVLLVVCLNSGMTALAGREEEGEGWDDDGSDLEPSGESHISQRTMEGWLRKVQTGQETPPTPLDGVGDARAALPVVGTGEDDVVELEEAIVVLLDNGLTSGGTPQSAHLAPEGGFRKAQTRHIQVLVAGWSVVSSPLKTGSPVSSEG